MNKSFIKSPLNYIGGKYKILSQIIPLFPKRISTFIDLFGGGCNIAVNVKADTVIYNDLNIKVVQILETFKKNTVEDMLSYIDSLINMYRLSKDNIEGFLKIRTNYNTSVEKNPLMLYTIICYAFNNQIRFNSKGEYNLPFGKNRSSFNDVLRKKFIEFCAAIQSENILFTNSDFREYDDIKFDTDTFIYCDPPYLNSTATYNEKNGWTTQDEEDLRKLFDKLNFQKVKWALSNNLKTNTDLFNWANDHSYTIKYINNSYKNCNYHKKDKSNKDVEVLIVNY